MVHVFYFLGIFAIMYEMYVAYNPIKTTLFVKRFKESKEKDSTQITFSFLSFGYILWTFCGLLTQQWPLFLFLILVGLIPKRLWQIRMIDAIISFALLLFAIINQYHLHIDLFEFIKNLYL